MSAKAKQFDVNILYSIGAVLAVLGHSRPSSGVNYIGTAFHSVVTFIYTVHMPLFFIIAGILLYNSKSIENKSFISFIKEKAVKLLTPYFVLTALFILPKGYIEHGNFGFLNLNFIARSFLVPRENTWGHFWFLPVLFICYIIAGGFKKLMTKCNKKLSPILFWVLTLVAIAFLFFPINTVWLGLKDVSQYLFFMVFGMLVAVCEKHINLHLKSVVKVIISLLAFAASVTAFILNYSSLKPIITLCMLISLLLLAKAIGNRFENIFNFISQNVFTIYIYSWIFQSFVMIVLEKLKAPLLAFVVAMFVVGIGCPLIVLFIYKKLKKLNCKFFDLCLGVR